MIRYLAAIILSLCIFACVTSENQNSAARAPKITFVRSTIVEAEAHGMLYGGNTAGIGFDIYFDKSELLDNVYRIRIKDPAGVNWEWNTYEIKKNWTEKDNVLFLGFCSSEKHPDFIAIGTYTAEITNTDGETNTFPFQVKARSDGSAASGSIYSHAAGKKPSILEPPVMKSSIRKEDSLIVDFEIGDKLAEDSYIWFYKGDTYLGVSDWLHSGGLESGEINKVSIRVDIPFKDADAFYLVTWTEHATFAGEAWYRGISGKVKITALEAVNAKLTLKIAAYGDRSNQEGQSWIRIVDEFKKLNPDMNIEYELRYDKDYHKMIDERLESEDVPDIAYMGTDIRWGRPWKNANQQFDLKPYLDTNYYDMKLIPPMGPNGEIYEIPLGTSNITSVLFMNVPLVESLGFTEPHAYDDIVAMVAKAEAAGLNVISIDGADKWAWASCLLSCIIARMSGDAHWVSRAVSGEKKFTDREFVDSLAFIARMVKDRVISKKSIDVTYGENISGFSYKKTLFMIQGQWAAGGIEPAVAYNTLMLAFPKLPGEKKEMAGSVSAAIQVGYGITRKGAENKAVFDAALRFLTFFNSTENVTRRLRDGAIVAPILKGYKVPEDLPNIVKQKVALANKATCSEVIDAILSNDPNEVLNEGLVNIISGKKIPEQVASEVEASARK